MHSDSVDGETDEPRELGWEKWEKEWPGLDQATGNSRLESEKFRSTKNSQKFPLSKTLNCSQI